MANKTTTTFKVTTSTPVAVLKAAINANFKTVQSLGATNEDAKALASTISYASTHADKAKPKDLRDIVKSLMKVLGDQFVLPTTDLAVAEASLKPKTETPKDPPKADAEPAPQDPKPSTDQPPQNPAPEKPKTTKKGGKNPPKQDTKPDAKPEPAAPKKLGGMFPVNITANIPDPETEELSEKVLTATPVGDLNEMLDRFNNGETFLMASHWTNSDLCRYNRPARKDYFKGVKKKDRKFPDDLDLMPVVYIEASGCVAVVVSMYDCSVNELTPDDLGSADAAKDGVFYCHGAPCMMYTTGVPTEQTEEQTTIEEPASK